MLCGYSKALMNPPIGIPIAGSYDVMRSLDRLDDFYARAVAISDGERRCVIVSVDICHMENNDYDYCRKAISECTGIDYDAVIVVCTHTHAGGRDAVDSATLSNVYDEDREKIVEFNKILRAAVIKSATEALADMKPSRIYFAKDKVDGIINIRRFRMKDGSVVTNPGRHNPDVDHPLGEPNPAVKLIKIVREGAKDVYLVNFGMHATTVGWRTYLSSDYPGVICRTLESALGVECAFLQGAAGDAVQINAFPSPDIEKILEDDKAEKARNKRMATYVGHKIVGSILGIHNIAKEVASDKLVVRCAPMKVPTNKAGGDLEEAKRINELHNQGRHPELPYKGMALVTVVANAKRIIRMQDEPDFYNYNLYSVAFGDIVFCCLPGEPFTALGLAVEEASSFENTVVLSLTNCMTTYFPTTQAFSEGGYEVATTSVGAGTAEIIAETAKNMLSEMKKEISD